MTKHENHIHLPLPIDSQDPYKVISVEIDSNLRLKVLQEQMQVVNVLDYLMCLTYPEASAAGSINQEKNI